MNRLAIQSLLLGAQVLGLENVVVVQGDQFNNRDRALLAVNGYRPTELIAAIRAMNEGLDFRGSNLREPTNFCTGATIDLGRGIDGEVELALRKVEAGADFLMSQPIFDPEDAQRFRESYERQSGGVLSIPVFWGLQILEQGGVLFSSVPDGVKAELEAGRSGVEIAVGTVWQVPGGRAANDIYLVPPIRRGGARDYGAAREFLGQVQP